MRKLKEDTDRKGTEGSGNAGKYRITEIHKEVAIITQKEKDLQAVPESLRQELGYLETKDNLRTKRQDLGEQERAQTYR